MEHSWPMDVWKWPIILDNSKAAHDVLPAIFLGFSYVITIFISPALKYDIHILLEHKKLHSLTKIKIVERLVAELFATKIRKIWRNGEIQTVVNTWTPSSNRLDSKVYNDRIFYIFR